MPQQQLSLFCCSIKKRSWYDDLSTGGIFFFLLRSRVCLDSISSLLSIISSFVPRLSLSLSFRHRQFCSSSPGWDSWDPLRSPWSGRGGAWRPCGAWWRPTGRTLDQVLLKRTKIINIEQLTSRFGQASTVYENYTRYILPDKLCMCTCAGCASNIFSINKLTNDRE